MKKLGIVHIIDILNSGGAERVLITLANLQYSKGHSVKVITTVQEGHLKEQLADGIEFSCLHRQWKWSPLTMFRLIKAIRKVEVVHVHSSHNLRYVFLAMQIYGLNTPVFFHEHYGNVVNEPLKWYQEFIMPKVKVIAVSRSIEQWALTKLELLPSTVFLLPNIILKESVELIAREGSTIRIVLISNFLPNKNIELAIGILERLCSENNNDFHLTIIGKTADEAYYQKISELIQSKNLNKKVHIISDCNSVQKFLPSFHLAIHTSFSESGPLVLIEYLAQNIPFVAFNTGEVVLQIKEDLPECIADSMNYEEWVKKIQHLLEADGEGLQLKLNTVFEKYFSAETYYHKCISIYETGLENKNLK